MTGLPSLLDALSPVGLDKLGGKWDQAILADCEQFTLLDRTAKARVRRAINRDRSWALIGWSEGMASFGVRIRSRDFLVLGLVGLSLFDQSEIDTRDAEIVYELFVRLRLARAYKAGGHDTQAAANARRALALLRELGPSDDPFDSAITGRNLDPDYVEREVAALATLGP
jgi:hypothetical protein